jgi:hypothetical protein
MSSPGFTELDAPWFVPAVVPIARCAEVAREEIGGSVFRPRDIGDAVVEEPVLMQLPIWRVELLSSAKAASASAYIGPLPIPRTSFHHSDGVALVCGKRAFLYDPTPRSIDVRATTMGRDVLRIGTADMTLLGDRRLDGDLIQADVTREQAERTGRQRIESSNVPTQAMHADHYTFVRSAALVRYPLVVVRYRYSGVARRYPEEKLFVSVSAHSGKVVSCAHPSALLSVANKLRSMLPF